MSLWKKNKKNEVDRWRDPDIPDDAQLVGSMDISAEMGFEPTSEKVGQRIKWVMTLSDDDFAYLKTISESLED